MSVGSVIQGTITRLIKGVGGEIDKIFLRPNVGQDVSGVDGKHIAGIGEIVAAAAHDGLEVGGQAAIQLAEDGVMKLVSKVEGAAGLPASKPAPATSTSGQGPATSSASLPPSGGSVVEGLLGEAATRIKAIAESAVSSLVSRIESQGASYMSGFATKLETAGSAYLSGLSGKIQTLVDEAVASVEKRVAGLTAPPPPPPPAGTGG
jgi:hypothetical protein